MSQPKMRVDKYGIKKWYLNSNLHREDGPAVEWSSGSKWWYLHGERHREGGPAIEKSSGTKFWYLHGKEFSFEDYIMELERMGLKDSIVNTLFNIG